MCGRIQNLLDLNHHGTSGRLGQLPVKTSCYASITLDKVCHTYRGKSAEEGIDQNYQRTDGQCHMIINAKHGLKQLTCRQKVRKRNIPGKITQ